MNSSPETERDDPVRWLVLTLADVFRYALGQLARRYPEVMQTRNHCPKCGYRQ